MWWLVVLVLVLVVLLVLVLLVLVLLVLLLLVVVVPGHSAAVHGCCSSRGALGRGRERRKTKDETREDVTAVDCPNTYTLLPQEEDVDIDAIKPDCFLAVVLPFSLQVSRGLTAAIPMENPCCSCKLTRVRSRCRTSSSSCS